MLRQMGAKSTARLTFVPMSFAACQKSGSSFLLGPKTVEWAGSRTAERTVTLVSPVLESSERPSMRQCLSLSSGSSVSGKGGL